MMISSSIVHVLWFDNLIAICFAANPILHTRTKYVELDNYSLQENILGMRTKLSVMELPLSFRRDVKQYANMSCATSRKSIVVCTNSSATSMVDRKTNEKQSSEIDKPTLDTM